MEVRTKVDAVQHSVKIYTSSPDRSNKENALCLLRNKQTFIDAKVCVF